MQLQIYFSSVTKTLLLCYLKSRKWTRQNFSVLYAPEWNIWTNWWNTFFPYLLDHVQGYKQWQRATHEAA
jgi:hypothetical protein